MTIMTSKPRYRIYWPNTDTKKLLDKGWWTGRITNKGKTVCYILKVDL